MCRKKSGKTGAGIWRNARGFLVKSKASSMLAARASEYPLATEPSVGNPYVCSTSFRTLPNSYWV